MTRDQIKNELKNRLDDYLNFTGRPTNKNFRCIAGTHEDNKPSMSYYPDGQIIKCFSCQKTYDIFDLIGLDYGLQDFNDQFKKACDIFNISYEPGHKPDPFIAKTPEKTPQISPETPSIDYTPFYEDAHKTLNKTNYAHSRGISDKVLNRFNIGFIEDWQHPKASKAPPSPRLIIPTSENSYIARDTRPLEAIPEQSKAFTKQKVGKVSIFNLDTLKTTNEPVFIVEGEMDALSIIEAGHEAIATGGTSNTNIFINGLKDYTPKRPLIIAMDNDKPGADASEKLAQELENIGLSYTIATPYGNYKDANEALIADKEALKKRLDEAINNMGQDYYALNSASKSLADFIHAMGERANTPSIRTGYGELDIALDGGLYEGLYILGAISSLGKTTYANQMADQLAKNGHDVIFFSLEMAETEIIAKSLSRETLIESQRQGLKTSNAKTTRGISDFNRYKNYSQTEQDLIQKAMSNYTKYSKNIIIHEGLGNIDVTKIRQTIEKHIYFTGKRPVVFIDYLQIIKPADIKMDFRIAIDFTVSELKRISRDLKIPVIVISSFNRENYKKEVDMTSFKESGGIEYSSDVLIGLQFKGSGDAGFSLKDARNMNPREIELVVIKNRNGQAGTTIDMNYYPMFNYFQERLYKMIHRGV